MADSGREAGFGQKLCWTAWDVGQSFVPFAQATLGRPQKEDFSMRAPVSLSDSLHHRLNAYALAATAAGVSAIALTPPAKAEIVYTPKDVVIAPGDHYDLVFGKQRLNFTITNQGGRNGTQSCYDQKGHYCAQTIRIEGHAGSISQIWGGGPRNSASALSSGVEIGPNAKFGAHGRMFQFLRTSTSGAYRTWGQWKNAVDRYLGLKFYITGGKGHKPRYGWARLTFTAKGLFQTVTLTGYAYQTTPNTPIVTGDEGHGNLGRLALGAVGR